MDVHNYSDDGQKYLFFHRFTITTCWYAKRYFFLNIAPRSTETGNISMEFFGLEHVLML